MTASWPSRDFTENIIRLVSRGDFETVYDVLQKVKSCGRSSRAFYHSLVCACQKYEQDPSTAVWFVEQMTRAGYNPDIVTYNCLIGNFIASGDIDQATCYYDFLEQVDLRPNADTFEIMINGSLKAGMHPKKVEQWLQRMIDSKLEPSVTAFRPILIAFAKQGDLDSLEGWMDRMPASIVNVVCWNSISKSFLKGSHKASPQDMLELMQRRGAITEQNQKGVHLLYQAVNNPRSIEIDNRH
jgi:pentatricopeptide repeat protein